MSRRTRLEVGALLLLASAAAGGCGGGSSSTPPETLSSAKPVATDAVHALAFDATLSADGSIAYFTGVGPNGPGVYSVPSAGGSVATIVEGDPFAAPIGIALSTDGTTLYVADPAAETTGDLGHIFALPIAGGSPKAIAGTDDTEPRGLDVANEDGKDQIYFTGTVKDEVGLFKVPAAGGTVTTLAKGAPFQDPEGVAVSSDASTVYVIDAIASSLGNGSIIAYDGTSASEFLPGVDVGYPSGISLSLDGKTVIVSSRDPAKDGASSLLLVDVESKEPSRFPLAGEYEPGGLHRAGKGEMFAWVSYDPKGASVYFVK